MAEYPDTPELDKLTETFTLAEVTQRLGEALDSQDGRFVLAAWVPDNCMNCGGDGEVYDIWKNTHSTCSRCKGYGNDPTAIVLSHRSPSNKNLADLFGLDYNKMEDEKSAVLKHVQEAAAR